MPQAQPETVRRMVKRNPQTAPPNETMGTTVSGRAGFVGIYKGIIIPGCLRWCRILSIHSKKLGEHPPFAQLTFCRHEQFLGLRLDAWMVLPRPAGNAANEPTGCPPVGAARLSRYCHHFRFHLIGFSLLYQQNSLAECTFSRRLRIDTSRAKMPRSSRASYAGA